MRIEEAAGLLGVPADAPPEALQEAYRQLALRWQQHQQQQSQQSQQQAQSKQGAGVTAAAGGGGGAAKVGCVGVL